MNKIDTMRREIAADMDTALTRALGLCDSPIEQMFLLAALRNGFRLDLPMVDHWHDCAAVAKGECAGLVLHYPADGFKIDFAIRMDDVFLAIELDGHDFHEKTKEQAAHDKKRERHLVASGWTVLRYTGSEVYADPDGCFAEAMKLGWSLFGAACNRRVVEAYAREAGALP